MPVTPRRSSGVNKIAFGAVFAALACVLLLVGGVFELLDMTSAAAASAAVLAAGVLFGQKSGFSVYAVSAVLTLILMPSASSTIYYALLFGYYPIFKLWADTKMKKKLYRVVSKLAVFNLGVAAVAALFVKLYGFEAVLAEFSIPGVSIPAFLVGFFVLLNIFLFAYDRLLTYGAFLIFRFTRGKKSGKTEPPPKKP